MATTTTVVGCNIEGGGGGCCSSTATGINRFSFYLFFPGWLFSICVCVCVCGGSKRDEHQLDCQRLSAKHTSQPYTRRRWSIRQQEEEATTFLGGLSRSLVKTLRCYCSQMCTAQPQKRPSNILLFLTGQLRFNKWQSTSPPLSSVHFTSRAKSLSLVCIADCLRGWVGSSLSLVLNRPGCFICQGLIGTPHLLVRHGKVIADITRTIVAKLSLCHWDGENMCADY